MDALATLAGGRVTAAERAPWGFENDTHLVTLADGRRLAVQQLRDRGLARNRLRAVALEGALGSVGITVPPFVAGAAGERANESDDFAQPYLVTALIEGSPGNSLLDDGADAVHLATEMGRLLPRLAMVHAVTVNDAGLDATWSDPTALAETVRHWMADAGAWLDDSARLALEWRIDAIPDALGGRDAVLAHGDFVPVNVLVRDRSIVALLDWEEARLADSTLDVAWWLSVVRHHHPDIYPLVRPPFLAAAGVVVDGAAERRMDLLVTLRHLEILARSRADDLDRVRRRAQNLRSALEAGRV